MLLFVIIKSIELYSIFFFFFLNNTPTTKIYPLPLHDALPISLDGATPRRGSSPAAAGAPPPAGATTAAALQRCRLPRRDSRSPRTGRRGGSPTCPPRRATW